MNSAGISINSHVVKGRRKAILTAGAALLVGVTRPSMAYASEILAVRLWPAADYTRITLESDIELKATHFLVDAPMRMVVDVEGLRLSDALKGLVAKVSSNDPFIQKIRVGQYSPETVRLVFDLKQKIKPQVFTLRPIASYKHRLVFDLYGLGKSGDPTASDGEIVDEIREQAAVGVSSEMLIRQESELPRTSVPQKNEPPKRIVTVALDPGHGGEDPGAIGRGGSKEKDVVLAIAKRLKEKLERDYGIRVVLTRDGDYFVPLHVRVRKARKAKSDLFVSIHADAWTDPRARGSSVFILSEKGASSAAARMLAAKENDADLIGGVNLAGHERMLASVLLDLSTTAQIKDSMEIARYVLAGIGQINRLHKGEVEQAGFAVLKAPDIPSILVETAFISNPEEEAKLVDYSYQGKMCEAIAAGISRYFGLNRTLTK